MYNNTENRNLMTAILHNYVDNIKRECKKKMQLKILKIHFYRRCQLGEITDNIKIWSIKKPAD